MPLVVYGDFNCPYSYLASQRVDAVMRAGQAVEWRAVERDQRLALTGTPGSLDPLTTGETIAVVAGLAQPGEQAPAGAPAVVSNTGAAVAAYAEAITDGVADELRRALFLEIWATHRHMSSPYEVRRVVRGVMDPLAGLDGGRLGTPDLPPPALHNVRLRRLPRLSGCTIAPDGGPLTTQGYQRIGQWRREWLAASGGAVPALVLSDGVLSGVAALAHLADLVAKTPSAVQTRPVA